MFTIGSFLGDVLPGACGDLEKSMGFFDRTLIHAKSRLTFYSQTQDPWGVDYPRKD